MDFEKHVDFTDFKNRRFQKPRSEFTKTVDFYVKRKKGNPYISIALARGP